MLPRLLEVINEINESLEEHAGSIELIKLVDGIKRKIIRLKFNGSCTSCGSLSGTQNMIKALLEEEFFDVNPQIKFE